VPTVATEPIDPRIRRTQALLREALASLMETTPFDAISVQDIADRATVNRVTFYDHYDDKVALLECMVAFRFIELLEKRGVTFEGSCASALGGLVLGLCDYLAEIPGRSQGPLPRIEPHLESAVIRVVRQFVLQGIRRHPPAGNVSAEMLASTVSWGLYGAAQEWAMTPGRCPSEQAVGTIVALVAGVFPPAA
jgi:AcrR family transcriptional regulator